MPSHNSKLYDNGNSGVFASALARRRSIDEVQLVNLSSDIEQNVMAGEAVNKRFRLLMEQCASDPEHVAQFYDFQSFGAEHDGEIAKQLRDGKIAAVDGTDRLSPMTFSATQFYVAGVSWVTSQSRGDPGMYLASTTADMTRAAGIDTNDDLWSLADAIDRANKESSWSVTFREFCERECALNLPESVETCLIDGPLFTQNLMTQEPGRDLLGRMVQQRRRYIGVIKGLDGSWAISRFAALSLRSQEVYILCTIQNAFTERFSSTSSSVAQTMASWLSANAESYVRCVYKPKAKSFAFECALRDVPYAIAFLRADASSQINHETPRLLQVVDADCRRRNNGAQIKSHLLSLVQRLNPQMAADLSDERVSR